MTSGWERAAARADMEPAAEELPSGVVPPTRAHALIVVDHFDPTMVETPAAGALVCIRQITRMEAMDLAREHRPPIVVSERILADVEKELGVVRAAVPRVGPGASLLVRTRFSWNDVRWHLVSYAGDA